MRKSRRSYITALVFFAFLTLMLGISGCKQEAPAVTPPVANDPVPGDPQTPPEPPPTDLSPITGKPLVEAGSPVAVTIDNNPDARPQTGLNEADIVYEVLAEGGITRYLAVFHSQSPKTLGPVRSSRPYFALLAKEWGAVFGHCGGDPQLDRYIGEWKIIDCNEFAYERLFWRDNTRRMPHNLYTSVENLRTVPTEELPAPEQRYEFTEWAQNPETGLQVRYSKSYAVRYEHDGEGYKRYTLQGSSEPVLHVDRETEEPVRASNVIVQFASSKVIDSEGRLDIEMLGSGKAVFLLGGTYSEGTWEKPSVSEPTIFRAADGSKISIARGQTWVQVVPLNATVETLKSQ